MILLRTLSSIALLGGLSYAQFGANNVSNVSTPACPQHGGAHLIVARASTEPLGYGAIGIVKDKILSMVPGSTAEFVTYPATLDNYFNSESDGVVAMRKLINAFIDKCSASLPLVVMGYSQGAQVTADSLVGQQVTAFPANSSISQPLSESTLARVAAAVMMGDPTFVTNETFHVGNASKNAIFPRKDVSNFDIADLASRTKSYCDADDPYCASGNFSTGLHVHLGYIGEYGVEAENFVVDQIKAFYANGSTTSSNGTSTGIGGSSATSTMPATYTGSASRSSAMGAASFALLAGVFAWAL